MSFPARQRRTHYRHELHTLTYVTLDEGNGGIIRNLNHEGVAVQAVAPLREQQFVRLRFELRLPRLRIDVRGQVSWANSSGQCGIRFVDLPARARKQIDEWIFSGLLESAARDMMQPGSIPEFSSTTAIDGEIASDAGNGLTVSSAPRPAIRLEPGPTPQDSYLESGEGQAGPLRQAASPAWFLSPASGWTLSGRALAWVVDSLVMSVALLLFALIFLSVAHELPPWPLTLGATLITAATVGAGYWALFALWGGASVGTRLAQAVASTEDEEESEAARRFR